MIRRLLPGAIDDRMADPRPAQTVLSLSFCGERPVVSVTLKSLSLLCQKSPLTGKGLS